MDIQAQHDPALEQVANLVREIKFAMLTTEEPDGSLRSRPMATMQMDADGNLWFFTALDSPKVEEAERHHEVALSYADTQRQDYLSISGTARLVRDRQKMESLWSAWVKPWFPQGLDDPNLVLLQVHIHSAEYWKAPGNLVKRLYGLAKGVISGNRDALGTSEKIRH